MKSSVLFKYFATILLACVFSFSVFAESNGEKTKAKVIVVNKTTRTLRLFDSKFNLMKTYNVSLGSNPIGPKQQSGDGKTPEGRYIINYKNPQSAFHLSLSVSYPNVLDRKNAKARGLDPGGDIMIHGLGPYGWVGSAHALFDWTQGCIAVTNTEIEEIYSLVQEGTIIVIRP